MIVQHQKATQGITSGVIVEFVTSNVAVRQIGAPDLILVKAVTHVNRLINVKQRVQNCKSRTDYSK